MKCEFSTVWPPRPHVTGEVSPCELPAGHSGWHRAPGLTWPTSASNAAFAENTPQEKP